MKKSQSSEYFNRLEKGLGVDEEGNITAGKNLEIDGQLKTNGGFNPIHSYVFTDTNAIDYPFDVYAEVQTETDQFSFFGKYSNSLCYGLYRLQNGKVSEIRILYLNDISVNPYILHGDSFTGNDTTDQEIKTLP